MMIVDLLRNEASGGYGAAKVRVDTLSRLKRIDAVAGGVDGFSTGAGVRRSISLLTVPLRFDYRRAESGDHAEDRPARKSPRGLYTGALGWVAPNGDCRFNVAIRTLEQTGGGHVRWCRAVAQWWFDLSVGRDALLRRVTLMDIGFGTH